MICASVVLTRALAPIGGHVARHRAAEPCDFRPGKGISRFRSSPARAESPTVAEVSFTEWTPDRSVQHPTFEGLRRDSRPGRSDAKTLRSKAVCNRRERAMSRCSRCRCGRPSVSGSAERNCKRPSMLRGRWRAPSSRDCAAAEGRRSSGREFGGRPRSVLRYRPNSTARPTIFKPVVLVGPAGFEPATKGL